MSPIRAARSPVHPRRLRCGGRRGDGGYQLGRFWMAMHLLGPRPGRAVLHAQRRLCCPPSTTDQVTIFVAQRLQFRGGSRHVARGPRRRCAHRLAGRGPPPPAPAMTRPIFTAAAICGSNSRNVHERANIPLSRRSPRCRPSRCPMVARSHRRASPGTAAAVPAKTSARAVGKSSTTTMFPSASSTAGFSRTSKRTRSLARPGFPGPDSRPRPGRRVSSGRKVARPLRPSLSRAMAASASCQRRRQYPAHARPMPPQ